MTIDMRGATPEDLAFVLKRLWKRGMREGKRIGFDSEEHIYKHLRAYPPKYFYTLLFEGDPIVIMGAETHDDICYTWFLATDRFGEAGLAITKFMNRFTRKRFEESGEKRLELWSASDHPAADKWFNALRFYRYGSDDVFTKYVFGKENLLVYKDEIKEDAE